MAGHLADAGSGGFFQRISLLDPGRNGGADWVAGPNVEGWFTAIWPQL